MDTQFIPRLIETGSNKDLLATIHQKAKAVLPGYPHNGCAVNLSILLQTSGIGIDMTLGAGDLANRLQKRGWTKINVGSQQPGDVGVTFDRTNPPGADHIYLVLKTIDDDEMVIADNQGACIHTRFASGRGKTPTEFFLRATS